LLPLGLGSAPGRGLSGFPLAGGGMIADHRSNQGSAGGFGMDDLYMRSGIFLAPLVRNRRPSAALPNQPAAAARVLTASRD
jgi:hypothetical protein